MISQISMDSLIWVCSPTGSTCAIGTFPSIFFPVDALLYLQVLAGFLYIVKGVIGRQWASDVSNDPVSLLEALITLDKPVPKV